MTTPILVLGNVNVDLVLGPVDGWPAIGTEIEVERAEMRAGGSAGNTALALTGLAEPHLMVASTGDDPNGVWLRGEFDLACCDWIDDPGMTTTTVGIVHKGGDRVFFTTPGHLQRATPQALLARVPTAPRPGAVAILSGNLLMPAIRDATSNILVALRERGWTTAIDPGWPPQGFTAPTRAMFGEWLALADHALLNEEEVAALTGGDGASALVAAMRTGTVLVVKRGPAGALALGGGEDFSVSAPTVEVIDTVGAGDSFNAAYLAAMVAGEPLRDALARGVEVASRAVSTYPRRYSE
ncbi:MAG: carbohydrate kinase family protein [Rhizobiaceae bacterium]|nr:carbohydrate kinase family protein [Rhizobiaceae bacterium]